MNSRQAAAAAFLATGFAIVSAILLFVEPGMGFSQFADYFDPAKVVPNLNSTPWLLGDLLYLGFGLVLTYLTLGSDDRVLRVSGAAAAVLFFLIGCIGRILAQLPIFISSADALDVAVLGVLGVRFAVLKTTVFALGVFAWRTTVPGSALERVSPIGRGLGYLVLAASAVFVFIFVPIPLLIMVWAAWLAVQFGRMRTPAPV